MVGFLVVKGLMVVESRYYHLDGEEGRPSTEKTPSSSLASVTLLQHPMLTAPSLGVRL